VARKEGYEAGSQHFGYLLKAHVDETDELAYEVGRNFVPIATADFAEGGMQGTARAIAGSAELKDILRQAW
jgi:hypothetical protein